MVRYIGSPGHVHEQFVEFCRSKGVEINGVSPTRCPDNGIGVFADRELQPGETIVAVPASALLTTQTIPPSFRQQFPPTISVQTLIAAYLCCDEEAGRNYAPWKAVWPTIQDFEDRLPMLWPEHLPLPPALCGSWNSMSKPPVDSSPATEGRNLLKRQEDRFKEAYKAVRGVFPNTDRQEFLYYWIVVNTRGIYRLPAGSPLPNHHTDTMALCPFADYFNHSDEGCEVTYDVDRYIFKTTRPYKPGEEVFVTYGHHSTDVLWAEYGFVPVENRWDFLSLDDIVLNALSAEQTDLLREINYLGNYHLTSAGPCWRTEVAATLKYLPPDDWRQFVAGHPTPLVNPETTKDVVERWIKRYIEEATVSLLNITELRAQLGELGEDKRFHTIILRWRLIIELAHEARASIESMR